MVVENVRFRAFALSRFRAFALSRFRAAYPAAPLTVSRAVCASAILSCCISCDRPEHQVPVVDPAAIPVLQVPRHPLSLGIGEPNDELTGTFKLGNAGGAPLEFRLKPGCGCTKCLPIAGTIPPHAEADIHVGIKLDGNTGTSRRVDIAIATNEPQSSGAVYHVTANCPAPFSVEPPVLHFGSIPIGGGAGARKRTLTIHRVSNTPLKRLRHENLIVKHEAPWLKVQRDGGDGETLRLIVALPDDLGYGYFAGTIRLSLADRPRQLVQVTVEGEILSEVEVSPASLSLKVDPVSRDVSPRSFLVFRPDRRPLGTVTSIKLPAGLTVQEKAASGLGHRRVFHISGSVQQREPSEGEVKVEFEGAKLPIALRLHFEVDRRPAPAPDAKSEGRRNVPPRVQSPIESAAVKSPLRAQR